MPPSTLPPPAGNERRLGMVLATRVQRAPAGILGSTRCRIAAPNARLLPELLRHTPTLPDSPNRSACRPAPGTTRVSPHAVPWPARGPHARAPPTPGCPGHTRGLPWTLDPDTTSPLLRLAPLLARGHLRVGARSPGWPSR